MPKNPQRRPDSRPRPSHHRRTLIWSLNPAGNAEAHGASAILTARNNGDDASVTVEDPATGHRAQLRPAAYQGLKTLLKQATADATASRDALTSAALELRHGRLPEAHSDPTGILALTRALAHATRRHALIWTRLSSADTTLPYRPSRRHPLPDDPDPRRRPLRTAADTDCGTQPPPTGGPHRTSGRRTPSLPTERVAALHQAGQRGSRPRDATGPIRRGRRGYP